jgi:transposase
MELSAEVAGILEGYTERRKTAQALALRARIVLGCASGLSNKAEAARERVTAQTVGKWRQRFVEQGLDGLRDEPRPGVPRKIDDAKVESVIVQTLESQPSTTTHWSTRSMARLSGISTSSVGRMWRAFGLQPHRLETFKLSSDPLRLLFSSTIKILPFGNSSALLGLLRAPGPDFGPYSKRTCFCGLTRITRLLPWSVIR